MGEATCPKCSAALKYNDVMRTGAVFPCPFCGTELAVGKLYVVLTSYGTLVAPAIILWLLGFSWVQIVLGGLAGAWPAFWLVAKYGKYILRPKLVVYEPPCLSFKENLARTRERRPPRSSERGPNELHLR